MNGLMMAATGHNRKYQKDSRSHSEGKPTPPSMATCASMVSSAIQVTVSQSLQGTLRSLCFIPLGGNHGEFVAGEQTNSEQHQHPSHWPGLPPCLLMFVHNIIEVEAPKSSPTIIANLRWLGEF
ncbi:hypothetical protein OPV22_004463 [Ensete ventricosum]|uniref:Uncharacterized protein n=1 Tax=Ensete ventricosum TaxID=4639 RepID=A0AAV8S3V1_ENSVE|nr:hypothetical protein OPV22_004463 [Ensete ventricosum]